MFSIFGYTPNRLNIQQENNDVTARKPGLSTRKPFSDRKVDGNIEQSVINKSKTNQTVKQNEQFNDMDLYVCSFKDTPETYADICNEDVCSISSIFSEKVHKTPPPVKRHFSQPDFIKNDNIKYKEYYVDSIYDKIKYTNTLYKGLDMFNDVQLPICDFDEIF